MPPVRRVDSRRHDDLHSQHRIGLLPGLSAGASAAEALRPASSACGFPTRSTQPVPQRADDEGWARHREIIMTAVPRALDDAQIAQFIRDGFVRIDNAFPRALAEAARGIMWRGLP